MSTLLVSFILYRHRLAFTFQTFSVGSMAEGRIWYTCIYWNENDKFEAHVKSLFCSAVKPQAKSHVGRDSSKLKWKSEKIAGEQHMQDPPTVLLIPGCWIVSSEEEASTAFIFERRWVLLRGIQTLLSSFCYSRWRNESSFNQERKECLNRKLKSKR